MRDNDACRVLALACLVGVPVPLLAARQLPAADTVTRPVISEEVAPLESITSFEAFLTWTGKVSSSTALAAEAIWRFGWRPRPRSQAS